MNQIANKKKLELEDKLRKVAEREKQLKNQLKAIDAREREAARKQETRAKIILGGFLASRIKKKDPQFLDLLEVALNEVSDRDKNALINYRNLLLNA